MRESRNFPVPGFWLGCQTADLAPVDPGEWRVLKGFVVCCVLCGVVKEYLHNTSFVVIL